MVGEWSPISRRMVDDHWRFWVFEVWFLYLLMLLPSGHSPICFTIKSLIFKHKTCLNDCSHHLLNVGGCEVVAWEYFHLQGFAGSGVYATVVAKTPHTDEE
jgi:hypothetical protein